MKSRLKILLGGIFLFSVITSILSVFNYIHWIYTIVGVTTYILTNIIAFTWIFHKRELKRNLPFILQNLAMLSGFLLLIFSGADSRLRTAILLLFLVNYLNWNEGGK